MIRTFSVFYAALLLIGMVAGCADEPGSHIVSATIQRMSVPEGLNIAVQDTFTYRLLIVSEEFAADSMVCFMTRPTGESVPSFTLYDDGGQRYRAVPEYGSVFSGDASAGDHIFTRKISARSLADSIFGAYTFRFRTHGMGLVPGDVEIPDIVVTTYIGTPQEVYVATRSRTDYFPACFPATTILVRATSIEWDPVKSVSVNLIDDLWYDIIQRCPCERSTNPSVWRCTIDPTFFRRVLPDVEVHRYRLVIGATTYLGAQQYVYYDIDSIGTDIPVLRDFVLPSSVSYPQSPQDEARIVATVELANCPPTGIPDFEVTQSGIGVLCGYQYPGDLSMHFVTMRDNGMEPDVCAGDNIYTISIDIPYVSNPVAETVLVSVVASEHDQASNTLLDSIRILP